MNFSATHMFGPQLQHPAGALQNGHEGIPGKHHHCKGYNGSGVYSALQLHFHLLYTCWGELWGGGMEGKMAG